MRSSANIDVARFKSFMAKTQLLLTQQDEQQPKVYAPHLLKCKQKYKAPRRHSPTPKPTPKCRPFFPASLSKSHTFLRTTKTLELRKSPLKLQCPTSIIPLKFPQQPKLPTNSFSPVIKKLRLKTEQTVEPLPSSFLPTVTTQFHKVQKTERQSKDKRNNKTESCSSNLTPRMKYINSNNTAQNISQLNRLVSREVIYQMRRDRKYSECR